MMGVNVFRHFCLPRQTMTDWCENRTLWRRFLRYVVRCVALKKVNKELTVLSVVRISILYGPFKKSTSSTWTTVLQ